jgi:RNA polymerase sigma-70 factor (ECF subfamily)
VDLPENEMVARARLGEEDALREIIERYENQVAATVTGILGNGPEVDDIGQETFAQFFRSIGRFRGEAQVGTFAEELPENIAVTGSRRDQESAADIKKIVWDGLRELRPEFQAVIVLRLINGYSTRETAGLLNLAQGTVLSRLARGQAKLREIIEDKLDHKS